MSAIDRRLDKLEETYAPPVPPVKWRRVIANDITEAEAAASGAAPDERLIVRLIISRPPIGTGERDNVSH
jgi:hypothetical protein